MSKVIDSVTVSRGISQQSQAQVFEELRNYFRNGWTLFSTHFAGIVGPELMMVYVLAKYEDAPPVEASAEPVMEVAAKKRGRPAKVAEVESA